MSKAKTTDPEILIVTRENNLVALRALLRNGVSPNCSGRRLITPIIEAASNGFETAVDLLLHYGADVNALTTSKETALGYAASNGHSTIVDKLLKVGATPNCWVRLFGEKISALTMSAGRGEGITVNHLIDFGASMNGLDDEPERPMVLAARNGHLNVVRTLLERGADANAKSRTGKTALIPFSAGGCLPGIELLLGSKVDINAADSDGMTALMWACRNGHLEAVQMLIKNGADVTIRDTFRQRSGVRDSALTWAINQEQSVVVKWLVGRKKLAFDVRDLKLANDYIKNIITRTSQP